MNNEKEPIVTVDKVLGLIIAVFGALAVLSLIWGQWTVMKSCFTVVFFGILAGMDFILVSTYGKDGADPELVLYKKR